MGISEREAVVLAEHKIKKAKLADKNYKYVEGVLYDHKTQETAIAELEAEYAELVTPYSSSILEFNGTTGGECRSHTETNAVNRLDGNKGKKLKCEIEDRKRKRKAVEKALSHMNDTEYQLVHLYYTLEKNWRECCQIMGFERTRWYQIKHRVVLKVAKYLGKA